MPVRTRTQRTANTRTPASTTAPVRPVVVDAPPTVECPDTGAVTVARAADPRVSLPDRRLVDGTFGESHLVWRCLDCGETGSLTAFPAYCPDCRAGRESLAYWVED